MSKREKKIRKSKKDFKIRLNKNQDSVALQNPNILSAFLPIETQQVVTLFANMFEALKESKQSRIKFKPLDYNISSEASSKISVSPYDDVDNILDSSICYHPKCSFAYNITKENLKTAEAITECVPLRTYQKLAEILNLDPRKTPRLKGNICQMPNAEEENKNLEIFLKNVEKDLGIRSEVSEDLQVDANSIEMIEEEQSRIKKIHRYVKFLRIIKSLEPSPTVKSNISNKARRITQKIINNFLNWYQTLGGDDNDTLIDASTLEELFQVGFELPESKALVIKIKELPTVPESLAALRNEPEHATRNALKRFLIQDIKREKLPLKMFAFGSMLPKEYPPLRYKPPRNFVKKTWMECPRVRSDLDTMKTIWWGLENLRSTIAFATWLKNHPEIKPPAYLLKKGLLDINYEEWNQMYKGFEMEVATPKTMTETESGKKTDSLTKRSSDTLSSSNYF